MEHGSSGTPGFNPSVHDALVAASSSAVGAKQPLLPWESGWVAEVLGQASSSQSTSHWSPSPVSRVLLPLPSTEVGAPVENVGYTVKRARRSVPFQGVEVVAEQARSKEVQLWLDIVWGLGQRSRIAQDLMRMAGAGESLTSLSKFLGIIVNDREPSTLRRHRLALEAWKEWRQEIVVSVPSDELVVFRYLMAIAESGRGTSKALVFLKSLLFVQHVFEVYDLASITKSRKIRSAIVACQRRCTADWLGILSRSRLSPIWKRLSVRVVLMNKGVLCRAWYWRVSTPGHAGLSCNMRWLL